MNIVPQETSLVIAGAWNPAILTPTWVMANSMQAQANSQMVQAMFPAGLNGVFEMPRYGMPGFQYSARMDALILLPETTSLESFTLVEDVGCRILENLSHTPIAGLGHNLEFRGPATRNEWLHVFANSQLDLVDTCTDMDVTSTKLATSFARGATTVNIQRFTEGGSLVVKFNFHHPVNSAQAARDVLRGNGYERFWANYQIALGIVNNLYPEGEGENE